MGEMAHRDGHLRIGRDGREGIIISEEGKENKNKRKKKSSFVYRS